MVLISASALARIGGVHRERDVVGFVDGRWLGALLGEAVSLAQGDLLELANAVDDLVELLLQTRVVAEVEVARQQDVERLVEALAGGIKMAVLVLGLACLVELVGPGDQGVYRIGRAWWRSGAAGG